MKKLNIFILALLIIGQTILGPIGTVSAEGINAEPSAEITVTDETAEGQGNGELPEVIEDQDQEDGSEDKAVVGGDEESEPDDSKQETEEDSDKSADDSENVAGEEGPVEAENLIAGPEILSDEEIATAAVEKAEGSKTEEDVDAAQALVALLKDNVEKESLQNRLDVLTGEPISAPTIIKENILTSAEIIIKDKNGNPIDNAGLDSIISVNYTWALENGHGYKAGSTFSFQLPEVLEVYNIVENEPMLAPNDEIVGYFSVALDGTATVEFTEYIEHNSNITGTLEVLTTISKDIIITDGKEIVITPIEGGNSITIPVDRTPGVPAIEKKGIPSNKYNAKTIEWTVDFNKTLEKVENAVLIDPIQEGQILQQETVKLYHLITKLNGTVELGDPVDQEAYTVGKTADGKDFTIDFKDDISTAYRAVYTTDIIDVNKTKFDNKAILLSNGTQVADADASVTINRGHPIAKSGSYDRDTQTITWTIRYNYDEKSIAQADAYLRDRFLNENNHELVDNSFVVKNVTIDENGKETIGEEVDKDDYIVDTNYSEAENDYNYLFKLQFNHDIDSAYIIEYQTKAGDRVFGDGNVENRVYLEDGRYSTSNQRVTQGILLKSDYGENYKDKTVNWKISFNHDKYDMYNVVLEDVFTNKGLTLDSSTIEITLGKDKILELGGDYKLTKNEHDRFDITFNEKISDVVTITYRTKFDYEQRENKAKEYLSNGVTLRWSTDPGNEDKYSKEAESQFRPDEWTRNNGSKSASYNPFTQEITWSIIFNYNLQTLTKASVEDFITQSENLTVDLESIEVHKVTPKAGGGAIDVVDLVSPNLYTTTEIEKDGKKGFKIEFKEQITEAYQITYKTSLKDLGFVAEKYDNKATVFNGGDKQAELDASVPIPHGGNYTAKSGTQNGKFIDWKVDINFAQANVSNATIIDTPTDNQSVLEQSFHLFATTVATNGAITKGDELTLGEDYTLEFTENPYSFKLKFTKEISKPYILEYQSLILAKPGEKIKNDITFSGDSITEGEFKSESEIEVRLTTGSGSGGGEVGGLTVIKTDSTGEKLLQGAIFTLKDAETGTVIKTETTNDDGIIVFGKLLWGDYLLVEDEAPKGYAAITEPIKITIDSPYELGDGTNVGNQITVANDKLVHSFKVRKVDPNGGPLPGAVFTLQKDGTIVEGYENLISDEDGWITVNENLEPGDYQLLETEAPLGYELLEQPISFTIDGQQTEIKVLPDIINKVVEGATLIKYHADNQGELDKMKPLANAEFHLYKQKVDSTDFEPVTDDGKIIVYTTDSHGEVIAAPLENGIYYFLEVKAPTGYQLNRTQFHFTIEDNMKEPIIIEVGNKVRPGTWVPPTDPEEPGDCEENPENPGDCEEKPEEPSEPEEPGEPGEPNEPEEPEDPDTGELGDGEEKPEEPGDDEEPGKDGNKPEKPSEPGGVLGDGGEKPGKPSTGNQLPQTGEENFLLIFSLGFVLLAIGGFILFRQRKTTRTS